MASWPELVREAAKMPEGVSKVLVLPSSGLEVTSATSLLELGSSADATLHGVIAGDRDDMDRVVARICSRCSRPPLRMPGIRSKKVASSEHAPLCILTLDGGGMKGLVLATLLEAIEERTGIPIGGLFDLVVGTSTGGVAAIHVAFASALGEGCRDYRASLERVRKVLEQRSKTNLLVTGHECTSAAARQVAQSCAPARRYGADPAPRPAPPCEPRTATPRGDRWAGEASGTDIQLGPDGRREGAISRGSNFGLCEGVKRGKALLFFFTM